MGNPVRFSCLSSFCTAVVLLPCAAPAALLFTEDFDADHTASWTVNNGPGSNAASFFYDYSTAGIPAAPNSTGTTRGLKLQANTSGGVFGGLSVSPTGQTFAGDYTLRFDLWMNYNGPLNGGGNGSTQITGGGIGTSGTTSQWQGSATADAVYFASTGDGGSASDYRGYYPNATGVPALGSGTAGNPVTYAGGTSLNNTNAFYTALYPGIAAPAAQLTLFPQQTGSTAAGTPAFMWHDVTIARAGNLVTWTVDGILLATTDLSNAGVGALGSGNILFVQADINATSSTDVNAGNLLFGLIDNVRVEGIPEPSTALVSAMAGAGLLLRRRRK